MSHFVMYLIVMFDKISIGLGFLIGICALFTVIALITKLVYEPAVRDSRYSDENDKEDAKRAATVAMKFFKPGLIGLIVCILLQMFTPTTKEAAVIVVVPTIINTVGEHEGLKKLPDNMINLANDWLVELKPENIKNTVKDATDKVGGAIDKGKETVDAVKDAANSIKDKIK